MNHHLKQRKMPIATINDALASSIIQDYTNEMQVVSINEMLI